MSGCVTKRRVNKYLWLNNFPLPPEACSVTMEYGFYRKLNNGKFEFVSACSEESQDWVSMHKDDLAKLLSRLPDEK